MGQPARNDTDQPVKTAVCPTCSGASEPGGGTFPFCSERCRMADLGKWFREDYRISREMNETDLDELE